MRHIILKTVLAFSILMSFTHSWAKELQQYDQKLQTLYQVLSQQLTATEQARLVNMNEKWSRYRQLQCADSAECLIKATDAQINNMNSLLMGRIQLKNTEQISFKLDINHEITQESYDQVRQYLLKRHHEALLQFNADVQKDRRRAYEIYNSFLYDYCELLVQLTPVSFLNCQIRGLMDYQSSANTTTNAQ